MCWVGGFFGTVVTGDDVTLSKPHSQPFLASADALNVPPFRCVVVEDSRSAIQAACRAGMRSVAVDPAHAALPATLAVASLTDLPPFAFEAFLATVHVAKP